MKRILRVAVLGFAAAFAVGFTVGSMETTDTASSAAQPRCWEVCGGGAYIVVGGQCVCM